MEEELAVTVVVEVQLAVAVALELREGVLEELLLAARETLADRVPPEAEAEAVSLERAVPLSLQVRLPVGRWEAETLSVALAGALPVRAGEVLREERGEGERREVAEGEGVREGAPAVPVGPPVRGVAEARGVGVAYRRGTVGVRLGERVVREDREVEGLAPRLRVARAWWLPEPEGERRGVALALGQGEALRVAAAAARERVGRGERVGRALALPALLAEKEMESVRLGLPLPPGGVAVPRAAVGEGVPVPPRPPPPAAAPRLAEGSREAVPAAAPAPAAVAEAALGLG